MRFSQGDFENSFASKSLVPDVIWLSPTRLQANEKPEPDGLWFDFSSGEWIRTTDLRVMSDFPDFGTFFTQALHFSLA